MERLTLFAEVLLPISLPGTFTYRVPFVLNDQAKVLHRVIVPFGNKRITTGIIISLHEQAPVGYEAKYIEEVIDDFPLINQFQIDFWFWIAKYYMCHQGEVMSAALPSGLKLHGETIIVLNKLPDELSMAELSQKETETLYHLNDKARIKLSDLPKLLGIKTIYPIIKSLWHQGFIRLEDEIKEKFKPLEVEMIHLNKMLMDNESINKAMDRLQKAPKQLDLLLAWLDLSGFLRNEILPVTKTALLKKSGANSNLLQQLVKKEVFEIEKKQVSRLQSAKASFTQMPEFSAHQNDALEKIQKSFQENRTVLLHGVTSSGKTEIYIKLIEECLANGKQALYLLPEIALTAQIILRLQAYFGDKVQVYHSRFSENERAEVWRLVNSRKEEPCLILGARSALFLPFSNLGLVIVDEEHESTFKQMDPAPRYNGRDAAIKLATMFDAKVILGSATPSLESFYNASQGKYELISLTERFGNALMPDILVNDLKIDKKKKQMLGVFSPFLLRAVETTKKEDRQSILFQNRRGFSPLLECDDCGWTPECKHCDISLTYHKRLNQLRCHYCGYNINVPPACIECGSTNLKTKGFGTEKIEEDLQGFFPELSIQRLDLDTTRSKYAYHNIIDAFHHRKIDVLVGTQMVTKGLDFDAVDLVGILNADAMLNYPDFRASERAFQLMQQVAGRAGRRERAGKVIIQTHQPDHKVINFIVDNDYNGFYKSELKEREEFLYPPFVKLIILYIKHKDAENVAFSAVHLATDLKQMFGNLILGPEEPPVARLRNMYIRRIMIKIKPDFSLSKVKNAIQNTINNFNKNKLNAGVRVVIDVDPA